MSRDPGQIFLMPQIQGADGANESNTKNSSRDFKIECCLQPKSFDSTIPIFSPTTIRHDLSSYPDHTLITHSLDLRRGERAGRCRLRKTKADQGHRHLRSQSKASPSPPNLPLQNQARSHYKAPWGNGRAQPSPHTTRATQRANIITDMGDTRLLRALVQKAR